MNGQYCSIFELYTILKEKNLKMSKISSSQMNPVFNKTLSYVERFNKFGFPESTDTAGLKALEIRKYNIVILEF
jgi:hypothetical protein